MRLIEAQAKALESSKELGGVNQHVNFKVQSVETTSTTEPETVTGYFYVSDWFDSDSTVFSCFNGKEKY